MRFENKTARKFLGVTEIFAALALILAPGLARADLLSVGALETLDAAGPPGRAYLPLRFEGMAQPSYFSVNPEVKTLLLSRSFVAENDLWEYHFEREIRLPQAGGGVVAGDLVKFYVLMVGAKALYDVQAIICDECAETAGTSLTDRL